MMRAEVLAGGLTMSPYCEGMGAGQAGFQFGTELPFNSVPCGASNPDSTADRIVSNGLVVRSDGLMFVRVVSARLRKIGPNDYVASWTNANINASGDTAQEAMDNLCELMEATWEYLRSLPKHKLGKGPIQQLSALRDLLGG